MKQGFLQSLGVAVYISLVGLFMSNAEHVFGQLNGLTGPILILMLLSVSVLICGLIVLYKPYKLFIAGKKKEALQTVIYTAVGLFVILILYLLGVLLLK